ncbi:hypothetical protein [Nesterenkonia sp. PF2B19]|uniref:hypothetical protein n=1 Tax=Nesterenkonia sp. PF2B19 TaxID=1881858 RepID=UPI00111C5936|nr:hypothetical protein [Nesterenkonia sp. PF2B19]
MSDDPTASDVAGAPALEATSLRETENPRLLLVLVPGLGTDVASTWGAAAAHLPEDVWAVGLDLPGHGRSAPWTDAPATPSMPQLARAVVDAVQRLRSTAPAPGAQPAAGGRHLAGRRTDLLLAVEHGASSTPPQCSEAFRDSAPPRPGGTAPSRCSTTARKP